jgi:hypothetical protein
VSAIKVVKGNPVAFLLAVKHNNTLINLNDGTWVVQLKLSYQTAKGTPAPFSLGRTVQASGLIVSMTAEQTATLRSDGAGYVLSVQCSKIDNTVTINNVVALQVYNDLF